MAIRPVQSLKHVIDTTGLITLALQSVTDIANTVDNPDANTNQVNTGSRINAIFLRVEVIGVLPAAGVDNIYMYVYKNPGANLGLPPADAIGANDNRKHVIHQEMIMLTPFEATGTTGFPRTIFKGVLMIPRGYRRMGVSDKIQVILQHSSGETSQSTRFCLQCIYKEYQ